ncbi:MAG: hypothetical protein R3B11_08895 [Nitrospira sp.]|nr:hypothetical protein [Nitrospira sp.]
MIDQEESRLIKFATAPLGIISLFVALVETVLAVAAFQTSGNIQLALVVFVMVFPLLIGFAFFYVLWNKPYVLYAPREYSDQTKVQEFVEAMQTRAETQARLEILKPTPSQAVVPSPAENDVSQSSTITKEFDVNIEQSSNWFEDAHVAVQKGDFATAYALGKAHFSGEEGEPRMLAWWAFHLYGKGRRPPMLSSSHV